MAARELPPLAGLILVGHLLGEAERRSASFDARLAALGAGTNGARDAHLLRDDVRQTRASVAVVQQYLREQAVLLRSARRAERKMF